MKTLKASSIILRLLAMCVAALTFAVSSGAENGVAVQKVQIADGIYQFITAPDGYVPNGNSVVIVNENDVLVFDTFTRPSTARTVLTEFARLRTNLFVTCEFASPSGSLVRQRNLSRRHFPVWRLSRLKNRGSSC